MLVATDAITFTTVHQSGKEYNQTESARKNTVDRITNSIYRRNNSLDYVDRPSSPHKGGKGQGKSGRGLPRALSPNPPSPRPQGGGKGGKGEWARRDRTPLLTHAPNVREIIGSKHVLVQNANHVENRGIGQIVVLLSTNVSIVVKEVIIPGNARIPPPVLRAENQGIFERSAL